MNAAEAERILRVRLDFEAADDLLDDPDSRALDFLVSELERKDEALRFVETLLRWPRTVYTGISSEAMVAYAIGGDIPLRDFEYPRDESDLERCVNVRRAASAVLHERMDEVLVLYRDALREQA